jgi:hypothetical protein
MLLIFILSHRILPDSMKRHKLFTPLSFCCKKASLQILLFVYKKYSSLGIKKICVLA